jgi:hypothetical protein
MHTSQIEEIDSAREIRDQNRRAINKMRKLVAGLKAAVRQEREILTYRGVNSTVQLRPCPVQSTPLRTVRHP